MRCDVMMASMVRLRAKVAPRRPGAWGIRWGAGSHLYHTAAPGKVRERGKRRGQRRYPQSTTDTAHGGTTPTARAAVSRRRPARWPVSDGAAAPQAQRDPPAEHTPQRQRAGGRRADRVPGSLPAARSYTGVPEDSSDRTPLPRDQLRRGAQASRHALPRRRGATPKSRGPLHQAEGLAPSAGAMTRRMR